MTGYRPQNLRFLRANIEKHTTIAEKARENIGQGDYNVRGLANIRNSTHFIALYEYRPYTYVCVHKRENDRILKHVNFE